MRGDGRRFGDAMSLWQRIEYGNIFGYFIDRPGTGSLQLVSIGLRRTVFVVCFGQGNQKC